MVIIGIDPGTTHSARVELSPLGRVHAAGMLSNQELVAQLRALHTSCDWVEGAVLLAIEMVASYGMAVGREVFETCVWIGRFIEAWNPGQHMLIYRHDVKMHLCRSVRAKDANIRQALLDLVGPQGTKKAPGPTYGVKGDAWSALAVAVTAQHRLSTGGNA